MSAATQLHAVIVCTGYDDMSHVKDPRQIGTELERRGYAVTCLTQPEGLAGKPFATWDIELVPGLPGSTRTWPDYRADIFLVYLD